MAADDEKPPEPAPDPEQVDDIYRPRPLRAEDVTALIKKVIA